MTNEPDNPLHGFEWAKTRLPGDPTPSDGHAIRRLTLESGRTEYFWAGDDLLAEARADSLTEYAMWGFVAEALWEEGELRHVINSQQGVPQELVDDRGKLVWRGMFDDWGKLVAEHGITTCRLRLPGQLADDETGLHYNRFRYYSPDAGQFVSAAPIGFLGGTDLLRTPSDGSIHSGLSVVHSIPRRFRLRFRGICTRSADERTVHDRLELTIPKARRTLERM